MKVVVRVAYDLFKCANFLESEKGNGKLRNVQFMACCLLSEHYQTYRKCHFLTLGVMGIRPRNKIDKVIV